MKNVAVLLLMDMGSLFEHPMANTLLTLLVGGLIFKWISDRRAKRDKVREKAIEFLDEIAMDMNAAISMTFGRIRKQQLLENDKTLEEKKDKLFSKRFTVRIKGEALLNDKELANQYDLLVWELNDLVSLLYGQGEASREEMALEVQQRIKYLGEGWPLDNEMVPSEQLSPLLMSC